MPEFVVYAKRTQEDIDRACRTGDTTGIVIAKFTAEAVEGRRIAQQIAENFLDHYFPDEWEKVETFPDCDQYATKGDTHGVAANISIYPTMGEVYAR